MSTKFKDFIHRFAGDDADRSKARVPVDVSYNGTSTVVDSKELEEALFRRFEEMRSPVVSAAVDSTSD
jgi:hypothetical protein